MEIFLEKMQRRKSRVVKKQPADEINLKDRLEILGRAQEIEKKVSLHSNVNNVSETVIIFSLRLKHSESAGMNCCYNLQNQTRN